MKEPEEARGRQRTLESLVQLVAALDRRALGAAGPSREQMTLDVAELRGEARLRIDRLTRAAHAAVDAQALSDDMMTDDGAPLAAVESCD